MNKQKQRDEMVQSQLIPRGIKDEKVLEAFRRVPRHKFVLDGFSESAYQDSPLPIGEGQTISQPYMVALMTELAKVKPGDKVLEIGTGSLYQAAILAYMGARVYSVERKKDIAQRAAGLLKKIKINDIRIKVDDGSRGWPENAPYDSIIVTAAAPQPPAPLIEQMAPEGRLVIPVGGRYLQDLKVYEKNEESLKSFSAGGCRFVPLIGEYGWER